MAEKKLNRGLRSPNMSKQDKKRIHRMGGEASSGGGRPKKIVQ